MQALVMGLNDQAKIASNACWALHNLASSQDINPDAPTSPLSPYFQHVVGALLNRTTQPDVNQANLNVGLYECINVMVSSSAKDQLGNVHAILPWVLGKAAESLKQKA